MTLRSKLLLAQSPLVAALLIAALAGSAAVVALGRSSQRILHENYRSVLAAQRMIEALERLDSGALFRLAGEPGRAGQIGPAARQRFEAELAAARANVTEPSEPESLSRLGRLWDDYAATWHSLEELPPDQAHGLYFSTLLPRYLELKAAVQSLLDLNQDAMVLKSDRADAEARRLRQRMVAVALGGCLLGLVATSWLTARLLRPLGVLTLAARRIGLGDLVARARVPGRDEIARLATEFNAMADQLQRYRDSSLGELLEAQQAAQATIDSLPDPIVVLDPEGHLLQANEAAGAVLGLQLGVANPLTLLDPAVREAIGRVGGHVLRGLGAYSPRGLDEAMRVRAAEGERYLLARATPIYASGGNIRAVTVVLQDVTRLRRFDELAGDLIATAAHEFRTPLTSLRMAVHLCIEGVPGPLNDQQADLLQAAREDCERLQTLVDELLDLSRMQGGKLALRPSSVDAERLVREAVADHQPAAAEVRVELVARVLPGIGRLEADRERLAIVLANLIGNALHHAPPGSRVEVRAAALPGRLRFEVADQGPGIPAEHREAIFEKHFRLPGTAASPGAGLGLYIAREIVRAHGGTIGVAGEPGQGSTFWFTLPAGSPAEQA